MNMVMFHSVGNPTGNWYRNWLSVSEEHFGHFCQYLSRNKYRTIHLEEWYGMQDQPAGNDKKTIALTFDDGYLDNWVFAYPFLKKYNLKGTVFVNPEFIDPGEEVRFNLEDVRAGKIKKEELKTLGFLNWPEIQAMDKSGVMDIQSHTMSHNFYFQSDKIIDIYNGQPNYDWPAWYLKRERKPFYITENQRDITPVGYPVFEFGRALGLRRYFPDKRIIEYSIKLFSEDSKQNKQTLLSALNKKVEEWPGRFETDEEMEQRYRYEIYNSKKILEEKLNKKVEFLCWPGGGYNELSIRLSIDAGYKASTISSRDNHFLPDNSMHYKRIQRFGMGSFITINNHRYLVKDKNFLIHNFKGRMGSSFYRNLNRSRKLLYILKAKF